MDQAMRDRFIKLETLTIERHKENTKKLDKIFEMVEKIKIPEVPCKLGAVNNQSIKHLKWFITAIVLFLIKQLFF